jgi:hypothetical protein
MQTHKFSVTCLSDLFMEFILVPPEHEKYYVDVSHLEHARIHCVTLGSHRMQKHKFSVMYPNVLFMEITSGPPEHAK